MQVGDRVGENFGWIGNSGCSERCPTSCKHKTWKYWNGITGGKGGWEDDDDLRIESMYVYTGRFVRNTFKNNNLNLTFLGTKVFLISKPIFFLVPPRRVALKIEGASYNEYIVHLKDNARDEEVSIDCIAKHATPTPTFEWRLGDELFKVGLRDISYMVVKSL